MVDEIVRQKKRGNACIAPLLLSNYLINHFWQHYTINNSVELDYPTPPCCIVGRTIILLRLLREFSLWLPRDNPTDILSSENALGLFAFLTQQVGTT